MAYSKWKDIAHVERYARRRYRSWDQRRIDYREKKIVRYLFKDYGICGTILDIPAGYGRFQPLLREYGNVLAADLGFMPILYQKERIGIAKSSVNCSAEYLPFKDKSVDVVFCFRLIQHMHKKEERIAIYREFKRVSKRWIIVSLYLSTVFHNLHRSLIKQPSRITMLTKEEFRGEAEEAELKFVNMVSVLPGLHANRICLFSAQGLT